MCVNLFCHTGTGNGPCMPSRNVVWNSRQCVFIHCTLPLANLHNRAVSWQHNTQSLTHDSRNVFIYSNGTLVTCSSRHGEEVPMSGEFTCRGRSQATGEDLVRTAVIPVEGTGNQEQCKCTGTMLFQLVHSRMFQHYNKYCSA